MTAIIYLAAVAALVACDQLIKLWALKNLVPMGSMTVISGVLSFTYVENRGAAFGIFSGQRTLLIIFVTAILCGAVWLLISKKLSDSLERISVLLIISGGLGNLIDRVRYGFVVDYIDINALFSYPMFNFADCCVVAGAFLLLVSAFGAERKKKRTPCADEVKNEDDNAENRSDC